MREPVVFSITHSAERLRQRMSASPITVPMRSHSIFNRIVRIIKEVKMFSSWNKSIKAMWTGLVLLAVLSGVSASATTYTVTTTADSGTGSLRAALLLANSGSDTIQFNLTYPATITLISDHLLLSHSVTITGPGASSLTISGGNAHRVFFNAGNIVTISGLTIANGNGTSATAPYSTYYNGLGGAFYTYGTLNLTGVTITGNSTNEGAAMYGGGTVNVTNCTISSNTAVAGTYGVVGGGIDYNSGTGGALTVSGSTISNNTAAGSTGSGLGGGIALESGSATVTSSTISNNIANGTYGGEGAGIYTSGGTTLIINTSTISGNSATGGAGQGGGIQSDSTTATINTSTISGNSASGSGGGIINQSALTVINSTVSGNSAGYNGGGILNSGTSMSLSFVTVSGNQANTFGGGCCGFHGGGIMGGGTGTIKNSIVANSAPMEDCYLVSSGRLTSDGYNLSDDATCTSFNQTGDLTNTAAGLAGAQANNGGTTLTLALLPGSPAIDAIPVSPTNFCTNVAGTDVTVDQVGTTRPQGTGCDIGAAEYPQGLTSQTFTFGPLANEPLGTPPFIVSATASSSLPVTFNSQTKSICEVSGTNGTTVSVGTVGTCTIQATQDGNATYAAATPVDQSFQVTTATLTNQTITFGALANQLIGTAPFMVSATSTSGLTVSFNSQTTPVCTVSGTTVTLVAGGTCTIQATQAGNAIYAAALAVNQSFQVTLLSQTITFNPVPDEPLSLGSFPLSANSSSGLTVMFSSQNTSVCTVSGATAMLVAGGYCTIQATQAGDAMYSAATPTSQTFLVETSSVGYGVFTHVNQFDQIDGNSDYITGSVGNGSSVPNVFAAAGGEFGQNQADTGHSTFTLVASNGSMTTVNAGPSVGVMSASNTGVGSARALAFATFNASGVPFHVNAVLDGQFLSDCCGLSDGDLAATAQVFVVNTASSALLQESQADITRALMGGPSTTYIDATTALENVEGVLAESLYPNGSSNAVSLNQSLASIFDTPLSYTLSTGLISANAGQQFTVVVAMAADPVVGGNCFYACGTGEVYFIHTLQPAPGANFFTDAMGNPVAGITPAGTPPPVPPTPGNVTLAPATGGTNLVGASASLTATVTNTTAAAAPLPNAIVAFNITSGPDAGLTGSGITGSNGEATFSFVGKGGTGTDSIQASVGSLTSNVVQETWTDNALTSGSACNGTYNGTFDGNLNITKGQNCVLVGGTVIGNITQSGGSLTINNSTVAGNVQIQGGGSISIGPLVTINGNLQIQNVPASAGMTPDQICGTTIEGNVAFQNNDIGLVIGWPSASCAANTIRGNVQVSNNNTGTNSIAIDGNTITNNLEVNNNVTTTGSNKISGNTVGANLQDMTNIGLNTVDLNDVTKNLQCQGNSPAPTDTGGTNTAASKQGQCAGV